MIYALHWRIPCSNLDDDTNDSLFTSGSLLFFLRSSLYRGVYAAVLPTVIVEPVTRILIVVRVT